MDNVLLSKFASIEQCIHRIEEEYKASSKDLEHDILRQDSIVLNLQRACEQCINVGQYIVKLKKLGLPNGYREVFELLAVNKLIPEDLSKRLQLMVGFRNIAIHEYQKLDLARLKKIVEFRLEDFREFIRVLVQQKDWF
jgi:uncharacterized protein YutE (UPF0331/DUF86 family)